MLALVSASVLAFVPLRRSIGGEELVMALASLPSFDRDKAAGGDEMWVLLAVSPAAAWVE